MYTMISMTVTQTLKRATQCENGAICLVSYTIPRYKSSFYSVPSQRHT